MLFSENEFDETGFSVAIAQLFDVRAEATPAASESTQPTPTAWRTPDSASIVILGGGAGGGVAAHKLRQRLGADHRIVVIDRSPDHLFQSSLLWFMVGDRREDQIRRPLERLTRKGIEFLRDEVLEIDLERRRVRTCESRLDFDYLIVALGAQTIPESIEGFSEMAHDLYSLEGCLDIQKALNTFTGGKVGVLVTSMPFKCPAAPYESALLVESFLRDRGVRDRSEIHLYTPEHQPMPVAEAALGGGCSGDAPRPWHSLSPSLHVREDASRDTGDRRGRRARRTGRPPDSGSALPGAGGRAIVWPLGRVRLDPRRPLT